MSTSSNSSPRKNLASRYLEAIGSSIDTPLRPTSSSRTNTPFKENGELSTARASNLKENENPFKSPLKKTGLTASPSVKSRLNNKYKDDLNESPVKRLIRMKERDTVENNAESFVPLPGSISPKKLFFSDPANDSPVKNGNPSRSQRKTMGNIAISMSNSPSLKNLNKLKSIEKRLISRSESSNRLKLTRDPSHPNLSSSWMDTDRKSLQTLEFLLRVKEAKKWLEHVLNKEIVSDHNDSIADFQDYLKNGIVLAMVTKIFLPSSVKSIYFGDNNQNGSNFKNTSGLYFKFTENITTFLSFLKTLNLPDMYIFETTDLFEMKNFPKVIFCIHALSHYLSLKGMAPKISEFKMNKEEEADDLSEENVKKMNAKLKGIKLPNFENIDNSLQSSQSESKEYPILQKRSLIREEEEEDLQEARSLFRESLNKPAKFKNDLDMDDIAKIHEKYTKMAQVDHGLNLNLSSYDKPSTLNLDSEDALIQIQSIARGSLVRYQLFVDKFMLKAFTGNVIRLQAIIRGNLIRKKNKSTFRKLNDNMRSLSVLQTILKSRKEETKLAKVQKRLNVYEEDIIELQGIARGCLIRQRKKENRKLLLMNTSSIIKLQSAIRGVIIRDIIATRSEKALPELPGQKKISIKVERRYVDKPVKLTDSVTRNYNDKSETEITFESVFTEFQSIVRGGLLRNKLNVTLDALYSDEMDDVLTRFGALARGHLLRKDVHYKKSQLKKNTKKIIGIQSVVRGTLSRFKQELFIDEIEDNIPEINELQSIIKGKLVRKRIKERDAHFRKPENLAKIIKLQSYLRSMKEISSYTSLIKESNPNLKVIKHFIGLLNLETTDFDIDVDQKIRKYKDSIVTETKKIEKWESELNKLEIKIKLLRKNKIGLDELMEFKNNHLSLSEYSHNLNDSLNRSINSKNVSNIKKADKSKTLLSTLFENLFYLLQTKDEYLSKLLIHIDNYPDYLHSKDYDEYIMKLFNFKNNTMIKSTGSFLQFDTQDTMKREEFLLMKLVVYTAKESFEQEFSSFEELKKYEKSKNTLKATMKKSKSWELLFTDFVGLPQQRAVLKNIMSDCILTVLNDYESSYESDPTAIFLELCEYDDSKSQSFLDTHDPIDDEDTKDKFVQNLSNLREAAYNVMKILMSSIHKLPIFIRCVCKEIFKIVKRRFPGESERFYLSIVGKFFIKTYVLPIFLQPVVFGINVEKTSENQADIKRIKKNLIEVAKVLNQLVVMRQFDKTYVNLQPLNPFIEEFVEQCRTLLRDLIDVDSLESCYDMDLNYSDLTMNSKPTLALEEESIVDILYMLDDEIDIIAPQKNDYLRYLLFEIDGMTSMNGTGLKGIRNMLETTQVDGSLIHFNLKPVNKNITDDTQTIVANSLMLEAKRYLIYILQIQDGEDLLDILVSPVTSLDELKFKKLIAKHAENKDTIMESVDNIPERRVINNIYNTNYPHIKKKCLEIILELERMGMVTRLDGFQGILNYIGDDIRDLREIKETKERELQVVIDTLTKLKQKERECSKMYKDYLSDIDSTMVKLQSKAAQKFSGQANKGGRFFNFKQLFDKQYYYHRQLKKNRGSIPKFGSFKYSAKYLYDRKILSGIDDQTKSFSASSSSSSNPMKINIMISCEKAGEFLFSLSKSTKVEKLTLDYILNLQYEDKKTFTLFNELLTFNTDAFAAFLFKKFYQVN